MKNRAIVLLSGGLDSVVSLVYLKDKLDIDLALTFDYGQKAVDKEIQASKNICSYYNIEHKVVKLDWLKDITQTSLVSGLSVPELDIEELNNKQKTEKSMESVWVPNRNALFVNIAASFADSFKYDSIIIGANKDEAVTFKDNSKEFIAAVNNSLKNSTMHQVEVVAPLINLNKDKILKIALDIKVPLEFIRSCYLGNDKQCGSCESCNRLKSAIIANDRPDLLNLLF